MAGSAIKSPGIFKYAKGHFPDKLKNKTIQLNIVLNAVSTIIETMADLSVLARRQDGTHRKRVELYDRWG